MIFNKLEKRMKYSEFNKYNWNTMSSTTVCNEDLLKESTYFKCIKFNAESVAKLPLILKKDTQEAKEHSLYNKLRLRPNDYMSMVDCIKSFIALGEHEGISALYIDRNTMNLYPAKIKDITIDNAGLLKTDKINPIIYKLQIVDEEFYAFNSDCIVYKSGISWDGIKVNSAKDYLKNSLNTTIKSQKYLSDLFENGMCSKVLVSLTSDIKETNDIKKFQDKFNKLFTTDGKIFVAPAGVGISPLNMSLSDSQFTELRKLSRSEIANAFGLTLSQIGQDNLNNVEQENLRYLNDTLLFKLQQLEQEFDYKYLTESERKQGYKIRFNVNALLRTNAITQSNILCNYVKNGIYTINDCRNILGFDEIEGGSIPLFASGSATLDSIINGDVSYINKTLKGGENNE